MAWRRSPTGLLIVALVLVGSISVPPESLRAQEGGITGEVLDHGGEPVTDAVVRLVELARSTPVDDRGRFAFLGVPEGRYVLEAESPRSGRAVVRTAVRPGERTALVVQVDPFFEGDPVVVSAGARPALRSELFQTADVVEGSDLRRRHRATLGETLSGIPGVSSSSFGPGAGRPIIRGLGGDRVQILEGGLTVGDASSTSPDHNVSVEPSAAQRIEIVRGPATLLYGSSAVAGAVNVTDGRIPDELPGRPVEGSLSGWGASVSDELAGRFDLTGRAGPVAWHASAMARDADDLRVPRPAEGRGNGDEHGHGQEGPEITDGRLDDSFVETTRGAFGVSYVGEGGHVGVSWTGFRSEYGVPGHAHDVNDHDHGHGHGSAVHRSGRAHPEGGAAPDRALDEGGPGHADGVFVDMLQRRFDAEGVYRPGGGLLEELRGRFAFSNYDHWEIEGREAITRIANDQWNARLEGRHRGVGPFSGTVGLQFGNRDFEASGAEAFVPPTDLDDLGVFFLQEARRGSLGYQVGARYERRRARSTEEGVERTLDGVSLSGGINWVLTPALTLAVSGSRSLKLASAEELFSDGPHLATRAFEVGDPDLEEERALTLDATAHLRAGPLRAELTGFVHRFDDFIFQEFTGEERAGLPVLLFVQRDARFTGFEAAAELDLVHTADRHLVLRGMTDFVRAGLRETSEPLPRIPPFRVEGGMDVEVGPLGGEVTVRHAARQNRVAPDEAKTPGYTMLDVSARYRVVQGAATHELILSGTNLTDEFARSHVSFLRDEAPFPGRGVRLKYRLAF